MSDELNTEVQIGDKVVLYHMQDETGVLPGTKGIVTAITKDPTVPNAVMIKVKWENGSTLPLLSDTDIWKVIERSPVKEQRDPMFDIYRRNPGVFRYFDYEFFRDFLIKVRDSGIVNMFTASPLIYAGRDHIERYYGEGREDDENFQELLDVADESRDKLVQGILKYAQANNVDLDDENTINSLAKRFSKELWSIFANSF